MDVTIGNFTKFSYLQESLNALNTLGNGYNLILADWNEETAIRLSNAESVQRYLEESSHLVFHFNKVVG